MFENCTTEHALEDKHETIKVVKDPRQRGSFRTLIIDHSVMGNNLAVMLTYVN